MIFKLLISTDCGLELAAELASNFHPLISLCSLSLHKMNNFFTSLTGVTLTFDPTIPYQSYSPVLTPVHHISASATPQDSKRLTDFNRAVSDRCNTTPNLSGPTGVYGKDLLRVSDANNCKQSYFKLKIFQLEQVTNFVGTSLNNTADIQV